jgi:hypothetical protein
VNTSGVFDNTTNPKLNAVDRWLEQESSALNIFLQDEGFSTPVTLENALPALDGFVDSMVAAACEGVNGSGRFGPTAKTPGGMGRFHNTLSKEACEFVHNMAAGLERMGVTRSNNFAEGIAFRSTDESGATVAPLFQRKGFGNKPDNWDIAPGSTGTYG